MSSRRQSKASNNSKPSSNSHWQSNLWHSRCHLGIAAVIYGDHCLLLQSDRLGFLIETNNDILGTLDVPLIVPNILPLLLIAIVLGRKNNHEHLPHLLQTRRVVLPPEFSNGDLMTMNVNSKRSIVNLLSFK